MTRNAPPNGPGSPRQTAAPWRIWTVRAGFAGLIAFVVAAGRPDVSPSRGRVPAGIAEGLRFTERAAELGVVFEHRPATLDARLDHIAPQVTGTGAAVSVCDANGDGWPDLYATTSADGGANALFVNRGDGSFDEVAARAGLADLNRSGSGASQGSIWADYDGDGRQDVFVYKWGRSQLFRNLGDLRFEDVTESAGVGDWCNAGAATWLDYDRDGRLDLLLCGYFAEEHDLWDLKTTRIMQDSFEFATNGGRNTLYRNLGDGRFEEVGEDVLPDARRWTYAAVAADLDRDGFVDLYVANDYGAEELFLNRGGERFERTSGLGLEGESKSGMSVALGNLLNDGRLAALITNISAPGYLFQGNNLRIASVDEGADGEGELELMQVADGQVANCGWAWGAQFGDLDRDGWQDLVVVNGFISASRDKDYWYQMTKVGGGAGELVSDAASWPSMGDRSLSGYERTRVLMHKQSRSLSFVEVGEAVGLADDLDGRAVAFADLDRDGDLDVAVANQRGPLLLYDNELESDGRWLGLDLVGADGNTCAIGAEVRVSFSGGEQTQVVTAYSGFAAQNDHRLFFGLGAEPGDVSVVVRWPSGREQAFAGLELDRAHRLIEGGS